MLRAEGPGRPGPRPPCLGLVVRTFIWIGLLVGSTVGGMAPQLWGDGPFSGWSLLLSMAGGLSGIWAGYRLGRLL